MTAAAVARMAGLVWPSAGRGGARAVVALLPNIDLRATFL